MASSALLRDTTLVNASGDTIRGDAVGVTGLLALYFAADWCPDCRAFQPTLNDWYAQANGESQQVDVVFVSCDASAEAQQAHLADKQGAWWMIPHESELRHELRRQYGIRNGRDDAEAGVTHRNSGIPALVLVRRDGQVLDFQGVSKIKQDGLQALSDWQKQAQA